MSGALANCPPVREQQILFSGPMVRAILAGTKTQTRRLVSRSNSYFDGSSPRPEVWRELNFDEAWIDPGPSPAGNLGPYLKVPRPRSETVHRIYPRLWAGVHLWVKETWAPADRFYRDDDIDTPAVIAYAADRSAIQWDAAKPRRIPKYDIEQWNWSTVKWHPSIFLPRWASRITLELVDVRVERLQEISEEDAYAEGVSSGDEMFPITWAIDAYALLWDKINGRKAPWRSNPFVWVLSFRRVKP